MKARRFNVVGSRWGVAVAGCALVLGLGAWAAPKADVGGPGLVKVRFGGDAVETRIVIELSRTAKAKLVSEGTPVVVDLSHIDLGDEREGRGQGLVRAWSAGDAAGGARLKLDVIKPVHVERRFLLAPADGVANYRYVIDLKADDATDAVIASPKTKSAAAPKTVAAVLETVKDTKTPAPKAMPRQLALKKVIVVDAGHGGHDPGALGDNVQEKAVTLAAAKALKKRLEASGRYKVVLTRSDDTFVPLDNRVQIARRAGADLFISLHADSGANRATHGASIYTLSDKGSDSVQRRMTSDPALIRVNQPGSTHAVNQILFDLTQRATRNRSASFAESLLDRISDRVPLLERSHRDAAYRVLLAPDVPAVLLEMGFITNADDEAFLTSPDKRRRLMDSVGDAIDSYFTEETLLATR